MTSVDLHHVPQIEQTQPDLPGIVDRLCAVNSLSPMVVRKGPYWQPLPSRDAVAEIVEDLRKVLFPGYFGISELDGSNMRFHLGAVLDRVKRNLSDQIRRGICYSCCAPDQYPNCSRQAEEATAAFLERLPHICATLGQDVQAGYEGDPAAPSTSEIIFCYPGILAIANHRIAHELHKLGVPLIPRIIAEHAHAATGIDIHPGAEIGPRFFIDHGTGVVIGETAVIGRNVRLYQGVTLGAKSFPLDAQGHPVKGVPRHPIVEDDVVIYSGATILGRVTIGRGSMIGGNVWLTRDAPPFSKITQGRLTEERFEQGGGI